jgi:predicted outer membrane repeat protein
MCLSVNYKDKEPHIYFNMPNMNTTKSSGGAVFVGTMTIVGGDETYQGTQKINDSHIQINFN